MIEIWPEEVKKFLNSVEWTYAKTYAKTWPHHYIVKDRVDNVLFMEAVSHIRRHGSIGNFYNKRITYFEHDGLVYWTMVPPVGEAGWYPIEQETIINRCPVEATYENRRKNGTLP